MSESIVLSFEESDYVRELIGAQGRNLLAVHSATGVELENRGNTLVLRCADRAQLELVRVLLQQLYGLVARGHNLHGHDIQCAIQVLSREPNTDIAVFFKENIFTVSPKKTLSARNLNQSEYLRSMRECDLTFGIGPAGTGKTYLAVAMAVSRLLKKEVRRIVLTRPAVEAGEKLGFLPGDLAEKINPYLRPLYDALYDMLDAAKVQEMLEEGTIEIAPLAFMRGRTLNKAFVILDEAQNTTREQMKMLLTRMGSGSQVVVTGDVTQVDLPQHSVSGLIEARRVLSRVEGVAFIQFSEADVIRHPLVSRIVRAYERFEQDKK